MNTIADESGGGGEPDYLSVDVESSPFHYLSHTNSNKHHSNNIPQIDVSTENDDTKDPTRAELLPSIQEEVSFTDGGELEDASVFQQDIYEEQQTRLRKQTVESFVTGLQTIAPAPPTHTYDTPTVVVGTIHPEHLGKKMEVHEMSLRQLLRDVNSVGLKYDIKYRESRSDKNVQYKPFSNIHPIQSPHKNETIPQHHNDTYNPTHSQHPQSSPNRLYDEVSAPPQRQDYRDVIPELKLRDLRRLDNNFNHHEEPYVLIRRHCVLISLGPHIRAIVQAERLLMLVFNEVRDESKRILSLLEEVILKLMHTSTPDLFRHSTSATNFNTSYAAIFTIPFEARAYGVLFSVSHSLLMKDFHEYCYHSNNMITAIGDHTILSVRLQEQMHSNKDNVTDLEARIKGVRRLLSALLEEDDDLLFLNLSVLLNDPSIYNLPLSDAAAELYSRYADIEPLMDSILIDFRSMENQTNNLLRKLLYTEQSVNLRLDTSRNELLYATTVMSVFASTVAFSGYITGAFGMNLDNVEFLQHVKGTFWGVFGATFVLFIGSAFVVLFFLRYYKILPSHAHSFKIKSVRSASVDRKKIKLYNTDDTNIGASEKQQPRKIATPTSRLQNALSTKSTESVKRDDASFRGRKPFTTSEY